MSIGGNQAISADALGVVVGPSTIGVERDSTPPRIVMAVRRWVDGRNEARAVSRSVRSEHVEQHWQKMSDDYSESWRWQANGF